MDFDGTPKARLPRGEAAAAPPSGARRANFAAWLRVLHQEVTRFVFQRPCLLLSSTKPLKSRRTNCNFKNAVYLAFLEAGWTLAILGLWRAGPTRVRCASCVLFKIHAEQAWVSEHMRIQRP